MAFDAAGFRKALAAAAKKAFARAAKLGEPVCGYALYSDSDAMTVSATINTASHLDAQQKKDPSDADTYRFNPGEWAKEGFANELFEPLQRKLRVAAKATQTASEWSDLRDAVFESCVSVLEDLREAGAFETGTGARIGRESPLVIFAVSDNEDPKNEKRWFRRLNPPTAYKAFATWITNV